VSPCYAIAVRPLRFGISIGFAFVAAFVAWQVYFNRPTPRQSVNCPHKAFVVVAYGQSQAANTGEQRRTGPGHFFYDGKCYALADPIFGASGRGGSIWPAFAAEIGGPVVIINGAVNGRSIEALSKEPLHQLLKTVRQAKDVGLSPDLVIYMQGETDARAATSAEDYLARLNGLKAHLPYAWLVTNQSMCHVPVPSKALQRARKAFANSNSSVSIGPDLDSLGPSYRQEDGCHFNRKGQDLVARLIVQRLKELGLVPAER
jgi:lysophospholipase L1-like esterase